MNRNYRKKFAVIIIIFLFLSISLSTCRWQNKGTVQDEDSYSLSKVSFKSSKDTHNDETASEIEKPTCLYYDVPLDKDLQEYILSVCHDYGVNHLIVFGMIERESVFNSNCVGDNGNAFGLMQIQPRWHKDRMDRLMVTDLLDPYQNVLVGIDYLSEMMSRDKGLEWALMAYNGGPTYANNMSTDGVVSDYANDVINNACKIELIY